MITYAKESYDKVYSSKVLSISTFLCLLIYLMILVIPFVLAYASNNFWISVVKHMYQPEITLLDNYYVAVLRKNQTQIFSNIQAFAVQDGQLPDTKIQVSSSYDRNSDGINDEVSVDISFGDAQSDVQQVFIMLFVNVGFNDLKYKAKSVLIFDATAYAGISTLQIFGKVQFYQAQPLTYHTFPRYDYDYDIFALNNYNMSKIFQDYYQRDYYVQPMQTQQLINGNGGENTKIQIRLTLDQKYPLQIKPLFLGTIKLAWIQYFSLLIPILIVGQSLLKFLFQYRFTQTHKFSNLPVHFRQT